MLQPVQTLYKKHSISSHYIIKFLITKHHDSKLSVCKFRKTIALTALTAISVFIALLNLLQLLLSLLFTKMQALLRLAEHR